MNCKKLVVFFETVSKGFCKKLVVLNMSVLDHLLASKSAKSVNAAICFFARDLLLDIFQDFGQWYQKTLEMLPFLFGAGQIPIAIWKLELFNISRNVQGGPLPY